MKITKAISKTYKDIIEDFFSNYIYPNFILDKYLPEWRNNPFSGWTDTFKEHNLSQQQINQFYSELNQYKNEQKNISDPSYR